MLSSMLLKTVLLLISTVFYNAVFTNAENPGLKVRLSDKAFLSATNAALVIAKETILSKHIPDQSGSDGQIKYHVYGMKLTQFSYGNPSVNFVPGKGTNFKLSNFRIILQGKIQIRFW
ncbi:lipopolysaccharide-binding protein [Octopus bimaculoides]|uniref:Lipid-binding serum glycoprotein N-terminal domain-containing protein n=1 Tax=Octopus bimaculoides TaxID=37653 RepID=A0A0L8I3H7_OCTBM|nr:lipopolysaccharide-binding protein [Octopus bimaculoides]|eukprot:XP_014791257.1 PREDICTED: lipopolysaccharide-binding protein-like [Octopus bimaculoides]